MSPQLLRLKQIISEWACNLPYRARVYLFGSYYKGTAQPDSDLDVAIEFLDWDTLIVPWGKYHEIWEDQLSRRTGIKAHLELYLPKEFENLRAYLYEASMIVHEPEEP